MPHEHRKEDADWIADLAMKYALAEADPELFLPDLAAFLNRLGNRLSDWGTPTRP